LERRGGGRDGNPFQDRGRWELFVRHRAGSLEKVIAQTRLRNLGVTGGLLALIVAAGVALVQFVRRAHRLAELQLQFVAGVSHELRTPLSVMRTAGHNLQGKVSADPARVQRYGALIADESEKLTAIVEQVLRFANVEAGRAVSKREPVEVASLIDEALAADRKLIEESHVTVEKDTAAELPPVLGDATMLKHALVNLITNAAKHGASGGWIGISAAVPGAGAREVEIRVKDRGPGIPADEQSSIFDPFYRGRRAVEDQVHGTGLGLSLTKKIVEAHHGSITVRSEPGAGTEFVVRIPLAPAEQNA
jgi:signal transduction histidine kinase